MKTTTKIFLIGAYAFYSLSSYADVAEDIQKAAHEAQKQAEALQQKGETALKSIKDTIDDITGTKARTIATYITESVERTPAFERAEKNPFIGNKLCVEGRIIQYATIAIMCHCVKNKDSFPYRTIQCKPCRKGLRQAHKEIFEKIKQANTHQQ